MKQKVEEQEEKKKSVEERRQKGKARRGGGRGRFRKLTKWRGRRRKETD